MRVVTALLICLGMAICVRSSLAQTSSSAPSAPASKADAEPPHAPAFEYLGRLRADIGTRTVIENGPQGTRTIAQIVGGSFEGPRLKAAVQTPAGDWITNRADGSYRLDVRLTLKTDDGALILVTYNGIGQTTTRAHRCAPRPSLRPAICATRGSPTCRRSRWASVSAPPSHMRSTR